MIECLKEWLLDHIKSLAYKVLELFLCNPLRWLKEKCAIIKRKYIIIPRIKDRIKNDLEYTCKGKPNPLLKEALAIIKKGEFAITLKHGYISRRESPFGIDVLTKLYIYNLSIKINQQKFLEYTNNKYGYTDRTLLKEELEKVIAEAFNRYKNLLNPDLNICRLEVRIESK